MTNGVAAPAGAYVQSLARGLAVIACFDAQHPVLSLADVARRADLNRAAARRFLHTLVELGYVRVEGRMFALTPKVLQLGFAYLSSIRLPEIAEPHLKALSQRVGESTSASVLDGGDIVYVARAATHRIMSVRISVGTRFPAYATSMGRVLLAALPTRGLDEYLRTVSLDAITGRTVGTADDLRSALEVVREQGYAVVDQELEVGLRSVAAPVRGKDGQVVAAVNVSTATGQVAAEDDPIPRILPELLATADRISDELAVVPID